MSLLFTTLLFLGFATQVFATQTTPATNSQVQLAEVSVLSFKEWKAQKIQTGQYQYKSLQEEYISKSKSVLLGVNLKSLYAELKHSKEALEELNELTVTDYFIGYLSQYKNKKSAFQAAVAKLANDEISELMSAYANSLLKTTGDGLSTAADSQNPK